MIYFSVKTGKMEASEGGSNQKAWRLLSTSSVNLKYLIPLPYEM